MRTPNRVRSQIRKYLSNYFVSTEEMSSKIGVTIKDYTNFMTGLLCAQIKYVYPLIVLLGQFYNPWEATENPTYLAAIKFFKQESSIRRKAKRSLHAAALIEALGKRKVSYLLCPHFVSPLIFSVRNMETRHRSLEHR